MPVGYSGTQLVKKLGIKSGFKVRILNPPDNYLQLLGKLPEDVTIAKQLRGPLDFIHFFTKESSALVQRSPKLKKALDFQGMLWISWPKKASKVPTDMNENLVREIGLSNGLVDVKVAAIDEVWSGLKFVYRLEDRPKS
ncbi:MAG: DUF3052 domain-containing protein [Chloroflexi bacterium]|nr:MAG: DUF3052 domain-containing protein [Chloroflexota bacterium]MBL1195838.1 DUF3052 domain-containing protein [Chloroflexota bacterium]NOH13130.1 DUF3052 domain-containing protein [Chloroflexota bacterium]